MLDLVTFVLLNLRRVEYGAIVISFVLRSGEAMGLSKLVQMLNSVAHPEENHYLEVVSLGNNHMVFDLVCDSVYAQRFLHELIRNSELIREKHPGDLKKSEVNRAKTLLEILRYICPELDRDQHSNDE